MSFRRVVKVLAGTAGIAGVSAGGVYATRPDLIVGAVIEWQRYSQGYRSGYVEFDDGFRMHYAEKGRPQKDVPSLVLVHGFSGNYNAGVPVTKFLSPDAHVITIDAPGHGKTRQVDDNDLRPKVMADRLKQFISKKDLAKKSIHLVGWAMGGTVAGFYASQYPEDLMLLTIACPGMRSPTMTKPAQESVEGDTTILLPTNEEERKRFWKIVMYKNNDLPKAVLTYLENDKFRRREDHLKVMKYMIEEAMVEKNLFIKYVKQIQVPTQIIWGQMDALIHVSGAELLGSELGQNAIRRDIVPECGHAFYAEEPRTLANLLVSFQADYTLYNRKWKIQTAMTTDKNNNESVPL